MNRSRMVKFIWIFIWWHTRQGSPFCLRTGCGYTMSGAYNQRLYLGLRRWDKNITMAFVSSSRAELSYSSGQAHLFLPWCMLLRSFRSDGVLQAASYALCLTWEPGLRSLKSDRQGEWEFQKGLGKSLRMCDLRRRWCFFFYSDIISDSTQSSFQHQKPFFFYGNKKLINIFCIALQPSKYDTATVSNRLCITLMMEGLGLFQTFLGLRGALL